MGTGTRRGLSGYPKLTCSLYTLIVSLGGTAMKAHSERNCQAVIERMFRLRVNVVIQAMPRHFAYESLV